MPIEQLVPSQHFYSMGTRSENTENVIYEEPMEIPPTATGPMDSSWKEQNLLSFGDYDALTCTLQTYLLTTPSGRRRWHSWLLEPSGSR